VLYNKYDVALSGLPENPPVDSDSDSNCIVDATSHWKVSNCDDERRVICQSG